MSAIKSLTSFFFFSMFDYWLLLSLIPVSSPSVPYGQADQEAWVLLWFSGGENADHASPFPCVNLPPAPTSNHHRNPGQPLSFSLHIWIQFWVRVHLVSAEWPHQGCCVEDWLEAETMVSQRQDSSMLSSATDNQNASKPLNPWLDTWLVRDESQWSKGHY